MKVKEVRAVETKNMVKQREVQEEKQEVFEVRNEQSRVTEFKVEREEETITDDSEVESSCSEEEHLEE